MKIVLIKNVPKIGKAGEVCEVKDGFAKNYLLPKGLAVVHGDALGQKVVAQAQSQEKKRQGEMDKIAAQVLKINGATIEIKSKVNEKKQLFASVNQDEIKKIVTDKFGIKPDKVVGVPLKSVGNYKVNLIFPTGKRAQIVVAVSASK